MRRLTPHDLALAFALGVATGLYALVLSQLAGN